MPDLGRWGGVDPLAERYYAWSGYNYVMGNPIRLIDPDGMAPLGDFFAIHRGQVVHVGSDNQIDGKIYLVKDHSTYSVTKQGGLDANKTTSLLESGAVSEISITQQGDIGEGEIYQNLFNDALSTISDNNPGGNEQAIQLIINPDNSNIIFHRVESKGNKNGLPRSGPAGTGSSPLAQGLLSSRKNLKKTIAGIPLVQGLL